MGVGVYGHDETREAIEGQEGREHGRDDLSFLMYTDPEIVKVRADLKYSLLR